MAKLFEGIIFDLDGVLVDAKEWHTRALHRALSDFGWQVSEDTIGSLGHIPTLTRLRELQKLGRAPARDNDKIYEAKKLHMLDLVRRYCIPNKRVIGAVKYATENYRCSVATNCDLKLALSMIEYAGLGGMLTTIVSAQDVGKLKPNPLVYARAAFALDLLPIDTVAIDDRPEGVLSALDAGCQAYRLRNFEQLTEVLIKNIEKSKEYSI